MLQPHRLTNLNYCLVYVSSLVIECLLSRGPTSLAELYMYCKSENTEINEQDITLSVSFLYLIDKAAYDTEKDNVKLFEG